VKRLEHFWKGLSHDTTQISPIPSVPYGDRFIKFITGITKTREEAEREAAEQPAAQSLGGVSSDMARNRSDTHQTLRSNADNSVIQKAKTEAIKTEKRGSSEDSIPDRTLTTVRSPSAERTNDRGGMTLPIVDEVGESSSTGGRSAQDADERGDENGTDKEHRPPTPLKDNGLVPESSPKKLVSLRNSSFDSNKALPPIPKVASPEPMDEKASMFA
jgi:1-phosphatidylinositol-4-phosphate 5-kinase